MAFCLSEATLHRASRGSVPRAPRPEPFPELKHQAVVDGVLTPEALFGCVARRRLEGLVRADNPKRIGAFAAYAVHDSRCTSHVLDERIAGLGCVQPHPEHLALHIHLARFNALVSGHRGITVLLERTNLIGQRSGCAVFDNEPRGGKFIGGSPEAQFASLCQSCERPH